MSSRPATPPPIAHWPFIAGALALFGTAAFLLLFLVGRPPAVLPLIAALVCTVGSVVVWIIPHILENERRLRLAEAAVRDAADAQLRRLAQTADQLAHVMSRSQSTEEQAGRALGTLEEVAERMVSQAEELVAALGRAAERETAATAEQVQRLTEERDGRLATLEIRLNTTAVALNETQAAIKKAAAASARSFETLAARLDTLGTELREAVAARQTPVPAPVPEAAGASDNSLREHGMVDTPRKRFEAEHPTTDLDGQVGPAAEPPPAPPPPPVQAAVPAPAGNEMPPAAPALVPAPELSEPGEESAPPAPRPRKPRPPREKAADEIPARAAEEDLTSDLPPTRPSAPLELALEGMPEPRPVMRLHRREPPGSTSLVATAYIGIGNKLYLRGDGPGLSWEQGVPMQFLAIGKWGWTTTEAATPVTCRVYRNDDTPMLEENIVIDPGQKAEITPKF